MKGLCVAAAAALGVFCQLHSVNAKCHADVAERGLAAHLAKKTALGKRQSHTNESQQAQILDSTQECAYYSYGPVQAALNQFPPIWTIASIVDGDTEAMNAYTAIVNDASFPNLTVKGTPTGDFNISANYSSSDPDCWWSWSHCTTPKHAGLPADTTACAEPDTWGLTYDDGPNCTHNAFYNYLQSKQYTATLFYIGSNVMDWPLQAQRGLVDGHQIGVHTWSHRYSTGLTNEQFFAELWYSRKAMQLVLGVTPLVWRPPYGDLDDRIRFIANRMNLTTTTWETDTFDWQIQSPSNPSGLSTASVLANYQSAIDGASNTSGTIVLSHELNDDTMNLAIQELPAISARYRHVVPVAVCQNMTHPYMEQSYTFPSFADWTAGHNKTLNVTGTPTRTLYSSTTYAKATATAASAASTSAALRARRKIPDWSI